MNCSSRALAFVDLRARHVSQLRHLLMRSWYLLLRSRIFGLRALLKVQFPSLRKPHLKNLFICAIGHPYLCYWLDDQLLTSLHFLLDFSCCQQESFDECALLRSWQVLGETTSSVSMQGRRSHTTFTISMKATHILCKLPNKYAINAVWHYLLTEILYLFVSFPPSLFVAT